MHLSRGQRGQNRAGHLRGAQVLPLACTRVERFLFASRQVPRVLSGALLPGAGVRWGRHRGLGARRPGGNAAPSGLPGAFRGHPAAGHRWGQPAGLGTGLAGGWGSGWVGGCGQSRLAPSQGMTLAGSSAGGRATVARTPCPCWCQWMRLTLCSWTAGPFCWMLTRLAVQRTAWQTWSPPR